MATKPEDQAGDNSDTDNDVDSLTEAFEKVNIWELTDDKEEPGAVEQKDISVTMPPPASPAEGVGGAYKQEKHGNNRGKDTGTSSKGEKGEGKDEQKTQHSKGPPPGFDKSSPCNPPTQTDINRLLQPEGNIDERHNPNVNLPPPDNAGEAHKQEIHDSNKGKYTGTSNSGEKGQGTDQQRTPKQRKLPPIPPGASMLQQSKLKEPDKKVLMTGKDPKDGRGSPERLQESKRKVTVIVDSQGEQNRQECIITLTDFLKYNFLETDKGYTERISKIIKQELNVELYFNRKHILVLIFSEADEQAEKIDLVIKRIFESMDEVEINSVSAGGLNPTVLDDKMVAEFEKQGVKFLSEYDEETDIYAYIYLTKDHKKVEKVVQSVIKTISEKRDKKAAKVATEKGDSYLNKEKECTADFCIVYKNLFDSEKIKEELSSHGIQLESSDITVDEEKNLIHLILRRNWKGDKEKDMQRIRDITEDYPANTVSYQDIKWLEKESTTHLSDFLEKFFSDISEKILEGKSLFWYVNKKARKVSVCTSSQLYTDDITNKAKSCLLCKEIDVNEGQNLETLDDVITDMNKNNQGQCICLMKNNKISIWGLKDYVKEAELKLEGILQQKEASRSQQDVSLGKGTHENGSPVSETNENDPPKKEPSRKGSNLPVTGLNDNGTSDTSIEENNATIENNVAGNNAPQENSHKNDKSDDETAEFDKLGNCTTKIEYKYDVAFNAKSKNAIQYLMKQGALDDLKRKYKFDIEINQFGVVLKVSNMAQSEAAKAELTKREESFEFVKKSVSLPYLQKDDLDKVISQSDADLADVVVFQDESTVPGPTGKKLCKGKRWTHIKGHELVLIEDQVECHWEELMIETVVGNEKHDGPKQCDNGRWKATLNILKAEDSKDLHDLTERFTRILRNVQGHSRICMSMEPVGNFQVSKYAKKMLLTVQTWLDNKRVPVLMYLCAPESYETYIRCFLPSKTYPEAEDIIVEIMTRSVSLTLVGSRDSNFQQAEKKIRKLAEEIKLKSREKKRMQKEDERNVKTCDEETRKDETVKTKARDIAVTMETMKEGRCVCSKKDSKISIWGLEYAVEEAEQKLHGISQQKKASKIHQHGGPEVSRHENGSPVGVTKENDAPEQGLPKNGMSTPWTGLSDNGTSGTTTMKENNATTESDAEGNNAPQGDNLYNDKNDDAKTESNAQGNNAPKDGNLNNGENNDDTTENDSLGNGTPKTEFMYEGVFKPKSKNALKLLMKQGALDELKRKYKFDLDINRYGVILKVPDMVLSGAVKDEITKMEESFEFVKKNISLPYMQKDELEVVIRQSDVDADVVVFQDESGVPGPPEKRSCRGKRWIHNHGHKIVLMNDQVEHHWEELMIEIVVGDGKPDGPKKCEDGRWKATLCIPKAKDSRDLHYLSEIFKMMLNNVQEHYSICMSLEPIGNFQVNKYAKEMLQTVQIWLCKRGVPVSLCLCVPESYETYIRCFNMPSGTYSEVEDVTVETMPSSVSLTLMGSRDSDFQQAEKKIRKLAEEIKLKSREKKRTQKEDERNVKTCGEETRKDETVKTKARDIAVTMETMKRQYQAKQNTQGNERDQTPKDTDKKNEGKDGKEEQFTPETYLIITKPASVEKIEMELGKLKDCKPIKIVDGPLVQGILLICQNEEDAIKLIRKKKKTFEVQQLKKTELKLKTMRVGKVPLSDDIKRELKEAQVRVIGKNKDILQAPTLHQIDFAKRLIESAVKTTVKPKEVKKPGKKSDSGKATAKPKEVTEPVKKSDTVEIQEVPVLVYELLKIKEKLGELNQKGEKIEYSKGCLRCPSAVQELSEQLKKMELDEFVLQGKEEKMDVKTFCDEINKNMNKELCVYDSEKQRVILFADAYDDMQKVKHQLNVKLERIKVTGRRGRRQMKSLEDTSPQIKIDFVWNRDAKNKEVFRTKEGMHVYVYEASIIKLPVECIVNAANDSMMHGGGIARVIAKAAGRRLDTDCSTILRNSGKVQIGGNIVTTAGDLPYRCVIHAVGPRWSDYYPHTLDKVNECEQDLYDAVYGSLAAAENQGLKTIALPAISSAIFGVPERLCVYQYAKATLDYSKYSAGKDSFLTEVHFIDIIADIVKKIQEMFITMVRDDKDPGYDSQEFVAGQSSWDSCSTDHGHSGQCNCQQPRHQYSSDVPKGVDTHRFQGNLNVHNDDLFSLQIRHKNAVVMFVDVKLQPQGPVAGKLVSLIKWKDMDNYRKERDEKRRNYGNIFVTNGYGCGFDNIIHVVSQGFQNTKYYKERKTQVMGVYGNILDFALRVRPIAAIVLTLIRIGDGADDMKLSAEAFKESFDKKMMDIADRNIAVHVVCNDSDKAHVVFNALDMKPTVPQESGYPSTSTSDTDMTWCNYNIKQGASATMMGNRMSGDDIDLIKDKDSSGADKDRGATGSQDRGHGDGDERRDKEELNCVICMDKMDDDSTVLKCSHSFCTGCIDQHFKNKQACPTCGMVCGIITGDQPDGTMSIDANSHQHCAGYPGHGLIEITYCFLNGQQGPRHPSPGTWYKGITRTAYLPGNKDGREICEMLKVAFHRRLVFTISRSTTTGQEGVINWNGIHHKTDPNPNGLFGYPDKTYLNRVRKELAAKGITPADIPSTSSSH